MSTVTQRNVKLNPNNSHVTPSRIRPSLVSPVSDLPFSLEQELEPFGTWASEPMWVPPKDSSSEFAQSMLSDHGLLSSKSECWTDIVENHRTAFQQVREIDLSKASIRLPKGKLFVSVTEQERFHEITDKIPSCVQTRLDEFMAGPGKQKGVKVFYLKPLCVEVGVQLHFTSRESVEAAIELIQGEVFFEYRRQYLLRRPMQLLTGAVNNGLKRPRKWISQIANRKQRAVDAYQAQLEFKRRKGALRAANLHRRTRTDGCTFEEMLSLSNKLQRTDVVEQFCIERKLSLAKRERLMMLGAESIPWFVALSLGTGFITNIAITIGTWSVPTLMVCDPAFVAEMPGSNGMVLRIGHFDEVGGVTHIEI